MNALQCIVSFAGSMFVDKIGRRPLLIWIGVATVSGIQATSGGKASSAATVAMIYIFQTVYSFAWTPVQALHPVEVISFEMHAKGMAFSNMVVTAGLSTDSMPICTLVNQFGFPVTMPDIEWKKYIVFTVWCLIQAALIYFFIPETKNRTLEELDEIFGAQNLMKASIAKKKLELDQNANIIGVVDLSKDGASA
ncbi:hypothetical protein B2J93_6451 [Marssonina coronariae]|uniref:Major facilitator superfamily (MFS) profile domain-containing protein n=1 Tax=Diplocarpon coronariae TaxID=2795749 RepID=A0A218Z3R1_9HELO|nr:hypothetical protein B2J93_6451 [Marssonina coronariae]